MTDFAADYASALFSLAEDMKKEDAILAQIVEIKSALSENPDFVTLLNSPALTLEERLVCVDDAFAGADEILKNFIKILTEKRAMHIFEKCAAAFEDEYNVKRNIEIVTAETAVPMSAELSQSLKNRLEKITGKTVILQEKVRPELLGGIKLAFRGKEIDGSILKKLRDMEKCIRL